MLNPSFTIPDLFKTATILVLILGATLPRSLAQENPAYDPLSVPSAPEARTEDLAIEDRARNRKIPILVYLPAQSNPAPVVLFSHGLGGARSNNPYLGRHWAARGYLAVFLQHSGSDESVWKDAPVADRMARLKQAASLSNFLLRAADVKAVLDQLETWNRQDGHPLNGRMDLARVGMSGHSFGAVTTQAVSGERFPNSRRSFTDPRIRAAVLMSPSTPARASAASAFSQVKIPWLVMTGTRDTSILGVSDVKSRLAVYPALPEGVGVYELVLDKAEHSAFSERALPGDLEKRNPNHHRAILALSTAFWDAYLKQDPDARKWLDGKGPESVLEPGDRWRHK